MRTVPNLFYTRLGVSSRMACQRIIPTASNMSIMFAHRRLYSDSAETKVEQKNRKEEHNFSTKMFETVPQDPTNPKNAISFAELNALVISEKKIVLAHQSDNEYDNLVKRFKEKLETEPVSAEKCEEEISTHGNRDGSISAANKTMNISETQIPFIDERFRSNLNSGRYYLASRDFETLSQLKPEIISKNSCIQLIRLLCKPSLILSQHYKTYQVYLFMLEQKMDIPLYLYNLLLDLGNHSSVNIVETYYKAVLEKFGVEYLTLNMSNSLFRVYIRNRLYQKIIDHYDLLNNAHVSFNVSYLMPFVMEATFAMGNEKRALELFYEHLSKEKRVFNVASAYSRLANIYSYSGRNEDSLQVLNAYKELGYPMMSSISRVLTHIYIQQGNLQAAHDELVQKFSAKSPQISDREGVLFLTVCFKQGREDLALSYVDRVVQHFDSTQEFCVRTLVLTFDYLSFKHGSIKKIEELFALLPPAFAFQNWILPRAVFLAYLRCNDIQGARLFAEKVVSKGFTFFKKYEDAENFLEFAKEKGARLRYILGESDAAAVTSEGATTEYTKYNKDDNSDEFQHDDGAQEKKYIHENMGAHK